MSDGSPGAGLGVGSSGFIATHGLHSDAQREAAGEVARRIRDGGLRTVRLIVVDQHGIPRAKYLSGDALVSALENGSDFSGAIYSLDTGNGVFPPPFAAGGGFGIEEMTGFPDVTLVPDPTTFRVLPYANRTGWILSDAYFANGKPIPLDGRGLLRRQLARLAERGLELYAGIEVELYVTRPAHASVGFDETGQPGQPGAALEVEVIERGYQFLSDSRMDGIAGTLEAIRDGLVDAGIPPRSIENEWGPGQIEITFSPMEGLAAADAMILFRSTVKAVCSRLGLHASFMCWPALPNFFPSGSHLHLSLLEIESGTNVFADDRELLSQTGRRFVAGLLDHAREMAVFGDPTTNAYARFRPYSFAPDRICWGSGQPRCAHPRPGRAGRRRHAHREPALRAGGEPVPLACREHRRGPRRHRPRRRSAGARRWRPVRGRRAAPAAVPRARPSTTSSAARSTGRRSAIRSSTTS